MALGDQAGLQAVQTLLAGVSGIEKFTDDERVQLTASVTKLFSDFIAQAGSVIQTDLAPLIQESQLWRGQMTELNAKLDRILKGGLLLTVPEPQGS